VGQQTRLSDSFITEVDLVSDPITVFQRAPAAAVEVARSQRWTEAYEFCRRIAGIKGKEVVHF